MDTARLVGQHHSMQSPALGKNVDAFPPAAACTAPSGAMEASQTASFLVGEIGFFYVLQPSAIRV